MLTSTQEDAHLAKIIEMSGASATFTWGTPPASYACSVGDIEENIAHDLDSDRVERQLPIFTRKALFTSTRPKRGNVLTYAGTVYRVSNDVVSGVQLILYCVQEGGG